MLTHIPSSLRIVFKVLCTIGLFWLIIGQLDVKAAVDQILGVERVQLGGALIVLFSLSLPGTMRWANVLKIVGYPLRFATTWPVMLVANFFTQALPSTVGGDVVRMAHGYRVGIPVDIAISNVVIDRLTSFGSLLLLIAMTLPNMFLLVGDTFPWWMTPFSVVGGIMTLYMLTLFNRVPEQPQWSRFVRAIIKFSKHLSAVLSNRRWGWRALVAGLVVHVLRVVAIWIIARGLNIDTGLLDCLTLIPVALLVAMIPISIGGWGLREGAFLGVFSLIGVLPADAIALSVTFGLSTIVASLPGGFIWLVNHDIRQSMNAEWYEEREKST